MDLEVDSDDEFSNFLVGEKAVKFLGTMKVKIRTPWANALIVKVFGKTVGFHFLHACIIDLWKPIGRMDCVTLGNNFFLITFQNGEDHVGCSRMDHGLWEAITCPLGAGSQILSH